MILVLAEAAASYNIAMFVGGLLCCLLGQGTGPDDEDEYFLHWFLWTLYDVAGSMVNEILVNMVPWDTLADIFRNIAAVVVAFDQFKKSALHGEGARMFVEALLGGDSEVFEDPEYGTNSNPFNL